MHSFVMFGGFVSIQKSLFPFLISVIYNDSNVTTIAYYSCFAHFDDLNTKTIVSECCLFKVLMVSMPKFVLQIIVSDNVYDFDAKSVCLNVP